MGKPAVYDDAFQATVDHYLKAGRLTEAVYEIDRNGGWADKQNQQARDLVYQQLAGGAEVMRNLIYTAWVRSGETAQSALPGGANNPAIPTNPISPDNPAYNPKTGSAPAKK